MGSCRTDRPHASEVVAIVLHLMEQIMVLRLTELVGALRLAAQIVDVFLGCEMRDGCAHGSHL